ncbi:ric1 protein [Cystoisospora suis]|uniref:Ric1 protein n=1 Tax=Cystoisospora suis TaxID=483139 RepID=A0A2C6KF01_9APIC|nr:ric1 protein [Cystoisospora suis]
MITSLGQATCLRLPPPFPSHPLSSSSFSSGEGIGRGDACSSSSSPVTDLSYSSLERSLPFSFSYLSVIPPTSFSISPCRLYLLILQPFRLLIYSNHQHRLLLASFTRPPNTFHFGCHVYATWQFQAPLSITSSSSASYVSWTTTSSQEKNKREGGEREDERGAIRSEGHPRSYGETKHKDDRENFSQVMTYGVSPFFYRILVTCYPQANVCVYTLTTDKRSRPHLQAASSSREEQEGDEKEERGRVKEDRLNEEKKTSHPIDKRGSARDENQIEKASNERHEKEIREKEKSSSSLNRYDASSSSSYRRGRQLHLPSSPPLYFPYLLDDTWSDTSNDEGEEEEVGDNDEDEDDEDDEDNASISSKGTQTTTSISSSSGGHSSTSSSRSSGGGVVSSSPSSENPFGLERSAGGPRTPSTIAALRSAPSILLQHRPKSLRPVYIHFDAVLSLPVRGSASTCSLDHFLVGCARQPALLFLPLDGLRTVQGVIYLSDLIPVTCTPSCSCSRPVYRSTTTPPTPVLASSSSLPCRGGSCDGDHEGKIDTERGRRRKDTRLEEEGSAQQTCDGRGTFLTHRYDRAANGEEGYDPLRESGRHADIYLEKNGEKEEKELQEKEKIFHEGHIPRDCTSFQREDEEERKGGDKGEGRDVMRGDSSHSGRSCDRHSSTSSGCSVHTPGVSICYLYSPLGHETIQEILEHELKTEDVVLLPDLPDDVLRGDISKAREAHQNLRELLRFASDLRPLPSRHISSSTDSPRRLGVATSSSSSPSWHGYKEEERIRQRLIHHREETKKNDRTEAPDNRAATRDSVYREEDGRKRKGEIPSRTDECVVKPSSSLLRTLHSLLTYRKSESCDAALMTSTRSSLSPGKEDQEIFEGGQLSGKRERREEEEETRGLPEFAATLSEGISQLELNVRLGFLGVVTTRGRFLLLSWQIPLVASSHHLLQDEVEERQRKERGSREGGENLSVCFHSRGRLRPFSPIGILIRRDSAVCCALNAERQMIAVGLANGLIELYAIDLSDQSSPSLSTSSCTSSHLNRLSERKEDVDSAASFRGGEKASGVSFSIDMGKGERGTRTEKEDKRENGSCLSSSSYTREREEDEFDLSSSAPSGRVKKTSSALRQCRSYSHQHVRLLYTLDYWGPREEEEKKRDHSSDVRREEKEEEEEERSLSHRLPHDTLPLNHFPAHYVNSPHRKQSPQSLQGGKLIDYDRRERTSPLYPPVESLKWSDDGLALVVKWSDRIDVKRVSSSEKENRIERQGQIKSRILSGRRRTTEDIEEESCVIDAPAEGGGGTVAVFSYTGRLLLSPFPPSFDPSCHPPHEEEEEEGEKNNIRSSPPLFEMRSSPSSSSSPRRVYPTPLSRASLPFGSSSLSSYDPSMNSQATDKNTFLLPPPTDPTFVSSQSSRERRESKDVEEDKLVSRRATLQPIPPSARPLTCIWTGLGLGLLVSQVSTVKGKETSRKMLRGKAREMSRYEKEEVRKDDEESRHSVYRGGERRDGGGEEEERDVSTDGIRKRTRKEEEWEKKRKEEEEEEEKKRRLMESLAIPQVFEVPIYRSAWLGVGTTAVDTAGSRGAASDTGDRILIGSSSFLHWESLPYLPPSLSWSKISYPPPMYTSPNWPIRQASLSPEKDYLLVNGTRGFALYSFLQRKWRMLGNEQEEREMPTGLLPQGWYDASIFFVCIKTYHPNLSSSLAALAASAPLPITSLYHIDAKIAIGGMKSSSHVFSSRGGGQEINDQEKKRYSMREDVSLGRQLRKEEERDEEGRREGERSTRGGVLEEEIEGEGKQEKRSISLSSSPDREEHLLRSDVSLFERREETAMRNTREREDEISLPYASLEPPPTNNDLSHTRHTPLLSEISSSSSSLSSSPQKASNHIDRLNGVPSPLLSPSPSQQTTFLPPPPSSSLSSSSSSPEFLPTWKGERGTCTLVDVALARHLEETPLALQHALPTAGVFLDMQERHAWDAMAAWKDRLAAFKYGETGGAGGGGGAMIGKIFSSGGRRGGEREEKEEEERRRTRYKSHSSSSYGYALYFFDVRGRLGLNECIGVVRRLPARPLRTALLSSSQQEIVWREEEKENRKRRNEIYTAGSRKKEGCRQSMDEGWQGDQVDRDRPSFLQGRKKKRFAVCSLCGREIELSGHSDEEEDEEERDMKKEGGERNLEKNCREEESKNKKREERQRSGYLHEKVEGVHERDVICEICQRASLKERIRWWMPSTSPTSSSPPPLFVSPSHSLSGVMSRQTSTASPCLYHSSQSIDTRQPLLAVYDAHYLITAYQLRSPSPAAGLYISSSASSSSSHSSSSASFLGGSGGRSTLEGEGNAFLKGVPRILIYDVHALWQVDVSHCWIDHPLQLRFCGSPFLFLVLHATGQVTALRLYEKRRSMTKKKIDTRGRGEGGRREDLQERKDDEMMLRDRTRDKKDTLDSSSPSVSFTTHPPSALNPNVIAQKTAIRKSLRNTQEEEENIVKSSLSHANGGGSSAMNLMAGASYNRVSKGSHKVRWTEEEEKERKEENEGKKMKQLESIHKDTAKPTSSSFFSMFSMPSFFSSSSGSSASSSSSSTPRDSSFSLTSLHLIPQLAVEQSACIAWGVTSVWLDTTAQLPSFAPLPSPSLFVLPGREGQEDSSLNLGEEEEEWMREREREGSVGETDEERDGRCRDHEEEEGIRRSFSSSSSCPSCTIGYVMWKRRRRMRRRKLALVGMIRKTGRGGIPSPSFSCNASSPSLLPKSLSSSHRLYLASTQGPSEIPSSSSSRLSPSSLASSVSTKGKTVPGGEQEEKMKKNDKEMDRYGLLQKTGIEEGEKQEEKTYEVKRREDLLHESSSKHVGHLANSLNNSKISPPSSSFRSFSSSSSQPRHRETRVNGEFPSLTHPPYSPNLPSSCSPPPHIVVSHSLPLLASSPSPSQVSSSSSPLLSSCSSQDGLLSQGEASSSSYPSSPRSALSLPALSTEKVTGTSLFPTARSTSTSITTTTMRARERIAKNSSGALFLSSSSSPSFSSKTSRSLASSSKASFVSLTVLPSSYERNPSLDLTGHFSPPKKNPRSVASSSSSLPLERTASSPPGDSSLKMRPLLDQPHQQSHSSLSTAKQGREREKRREEEEEGEQQGNRFTFSYAPSHLPGFLHLHSKTIRKAAREGRRNRSHNAILPFSRHHLFFNEKDLHSQGKGSLQDRPSSKNLHPSASSSGKRDLYEIHTPRSSSPLGVAKLLSKKGGDERCRKEAREDEEEDRLLFSGTQNGREREDGSERGEEEEEKREREGEGRNVLRRSMSGSVCETWGRTRKDSFFCLADRKGRERGRGEGGVYTPVAMSDLGFASTQSRPDLEEEEDEEEESLLGKTALSSQDDSFYGGLGDHLRCPFTPLPSHPLPLWKSHHKRKGKMKEKTPHATSRCEKKEGKEEEEREGEQEERDREEAMLKEGRRAREKAVVEKEKEEEKNNREGDNEVKKGEFSLRLTLSRVSPVKREEEGRPTSISRGFKKGAENEDSRETDRVHERSREGVRGERKKKKEIEEKKDRKNEQEEEDRQRGGRIQGRQGGVSAEGLSDESDSVKTSREKREKQQIEEEKKKEEKGQKRERDEGSDHGMFLQCTRDTSMREEKSKRKEKKREEEEGDPFFLSRRGTRHEGGDDSACCCLGGVYVWLQDTDGLSLLSFSFHLHPSPFSFSSRPRLQKKLFSSSPPSYSRLLSPSRKKTMSVGVVREEVDARRAERGRGRDQEEKEKEKEEREGKGGGGDVDKEERESFDESRVASPSCSFVSSVLYHEESIDVVCRSIPLLLPIEQRPQPLHIAGIYAALGVVVACSPTRGILSSSSFPSSSSPAVSDGTSSSSSSQRQGTLSSRISPPCMDLRLQLQPCLHPLIRRLFTYAASSSSLFSSSSSLSMVRSHASSNPLHSLFHSSSSSSSPSLRQRCSSAQCAMACNAIELLFYHLRTSPFFTHLIELSLFEIFNQILPHFSREMQKALEYRKQLRKSFFSSSASSSEKGRLLSRKDKDKKNLDPASDTSTRRTRTTHSKGQDLTFLSPLSSSLIDISSSSSSSPSLIHISSSSSSSCHSLPLSFSLPNLIERTSSERDEKPLLLKKEEEGHGDAQVYDLQQQGNNSIPMCQERREDGETTEERSGVKKGASKKSSFFFRKKSERGSLSSFLPQISPLRQHAFHPAEHHYNDPREISRPLHMPTPPSLLLDELYYHERERVVYQRILKGDEGYILTLPQTNLHSSSSSFSFSSSSSSPCLHMMNRIQPKTHAFSEIDNVFSSNREERKDVFLSSSLSSSPSERRPPPPPLMEIPSQVKRDEKNIGRYVVREKGNEEEERRQGNEEEEKKRRKRSEGDGYEFHLLKDKDMKRALIFLSIPNFLGKESFPFCPTHDLREDSRSLFFFSERRRKEISEGHSVSPSGQQLVSSLHAVQMALASLPGGLSLYLLLRVLLVRYPSILRKVIASCIRKTEPLRAPLIFFPLLGLSPRQFFQEALDHNFLHTASLYLVVLQNIEGPLRVRQYRALPLLKAALDLGIFDLAKKLIRFILTLIAGYRGRREGERAKGKDEEEEDQRKLHIVGEDVQEKTGGVERERRGEGGRKSSFCSSGPVIQLPWSDGALPRLWSPQVWRRGEKKKKERKKKDDVKEETRGEVSVKGRKRGQEEEEKEKREPSQRRQDRRWRGGGEQERRCRSMEGSDEEELLSLEEEKDDLGITERENMSFSPDEIRSWLTIEGEEEEEYDEEQVSKSEILELYRQLEEIIAESVFSSFRHLQWLRLFHLTATLALDLPTWLLPFHMELQQLFHLEERTSPNLSPQEIISSSLSPSSSPPPLVIKPLAFEKILRSFASQLLLGGDDEVYTFFSPLAWKKNLSLFLSSPPLIDSVDGRSSSHDMSGRKSQAMVHEASPLSPSSLPLSTFVTLPPSSSPLSSSSSACKKIAAIPFPSSISPLRPECLLLTFRSSFTQNLLVNDLLFIDLPIILSLSSSSSSSQKKATSERALAHATRGFMKGGEGNGEDKTQRAYSNREGTPPHTPPKSMMVDNRYLENSGGVIHHHGTQKAGESQRGGERGIALNESSLFQTPPFVLLEREKEFGKKDHQFILNAVKENIGKFLLSIFLRMDLPIPVLALLTGSKDAWGVQTALIACPELLYQILETREEKIHHHGVQASCIEKHEKEEEMKKKMETETDQTDRHLKEEELGQGTFSSECQEEEVTTELPSHRSKERRRRFRWEEGLPPRVELWLYLQAEAALIRLRYAEHEMRQQAMTR